MSSFVYIGLARKLMAVFILIMLVGEGMTFYLIPSAQVLRKDSMSAVVQTEEKSLADFTEIVKRELQSVLAIRQEKR